MIDLWTAVKDLPIAIESSAFEAAMPSGPTGLEDYSTTQLRLQGRGEEGVGEQVGLADAQESLRASDFPLTGEWATLADFLAHVDTIDMWAEPPEYELARNWRRWTFESAALDLALRQSATSLPEVLGRTPQPVTFVTSFGLGDPPDVGKVAGRRAMHPTVGFKLDVAPSWTQEIMDRVAAVEGVATIDFKGQYGLEIEDESALLAMYERTLATFTEAVFEDPHDHPAILELLTPISDRVSYDAPITSVESIAQAPSTCGSSTSSPAASAACRSSVASTPTASPPASRCTTAAWARSASAAVKPSSSHRSSTPTRPTTSPRRTTTSSSHRSACHRAPSTPHRTAASAAGDPGGSAGRASRPGTQKAPHVRGFPFPCAEEDSNLHGP
jgi:hypothetical protein